MPLYQVVNAAAGVVRQVGTNTATVPTNTTLTAQDGATVLTAENGVPLTTQ